MKMTTLTQPKKCGLVPKGYEDTHVSMPPDLLQWVKEQLKGLAALVYHLLAQEPARRAAPVDQL